MHATSPRGTFGLVTACVLAVSLTAASPADAQQTSPRPATAAASPAVVPVSTYTLPNGLKVIFHIDRSDPVVAVALSAHVGSSREEPGRTGFAHMFEHLFFLDSENVGPGGVDKLSARVGGSGANGFTTRDVTVYQQAVPSDALEKMIWAEADKLGYFIKTVTGPVLQKEKQIVKNEKRQGVDNRPYGHVPMVAGSALYSPSHPYHWQVIGSMADLDAAELGDVQRFYKRWYVPNNTALVIAGDFDPAKARRWIERYFGEIPVGQPVARRAPGPAGLAASRTLMFEDAYAKLPLLTIVWPGAPAASSDVAALDVLARILADGRDAPLNKLLVEELRLTNQVSVGHNDDELAGELTVRVRAFDGVALDQVKTALEQGFRRFVSAGVDPAALARAKASIEVATLGSLTSVLDKAAAIAVTQAVTGDPASIDAQLRQVRSVTAAQVMDVYRRYLDKKPFVAVSAVPKGQAALALSGSEPAKLDIEAIVPGAEAELTALERPAFERTPSRIDRSVEPDFGPTARVRPPAVWQATAANGLALSGIEDRELPIASFAFAFDGGQRLDDPARPGAANLLARLLTRGTARRTPAEFENALKALGARVTATATQDHIVLQGSTLSRHWPAAMALVRELLLEPRWDPAELALAKAAVGAEIADARSDPAALARRVADVVSHGPASVLSRDIVGTTTSVAALTLDDLKTFHARNLSPSAARVRVTGAVSHAQVVNALAPLVAAWKPHPVTVPVLPMAPPPRDRLYFYDVPDAKQSMLLFTAPAPARADSEFYPTVVANYILGGGGFASRLVQELRESKGYTYSILSDIEGRTTSGRFVIQGAVRANVTLQAATLARQIVSDYARTFTSADLELTQAFLTRRRAFAFETPQGKLGLLANIGDYGLPVDYPQREAAVLQGMTTARIGSLAERTMAPERLVYIIVGDAATQAAGLDKLGLGKPVDANKLLAE